jgi:hypothetical protein
MDPIRDIPGPATHDTDHHITAAITTLLGRWDVMWKAIRIGAIKPVEG